MAEEGITQELRRRRRAVSRSACRNKAALSSLSTEAAVPVSSGVPGIFRGTPAVVTM